jgi:D-alanine-D-alanine ligase-like ATP-grasp enzyme
MQNLASELPLQGLRICLLTDQDLEQDPFPEGDWPCDPRPYVPEAEWETAVLTKKDAVSRVTELSRRGVDVFFNLCDGAWDEGRPGIEVVRTLEQLDQAFSGADSTFFEPSREEMKRVCRAWDIDTPGYLIATCDADVEQAVEMLRFPLIVKHPSSYASTGLTPDSRVETAIDLADRVREMADAYGSALIEEFIDGEEATVLVSEDPDDPSTPKTYTPVRYNFPPGETFKHYDLKWVDFEGLHAEPLRDEALATRLREVSSRFFVGLRGAGYGRCDLRIDADGRCMMLEINPNCGVFYPMDAPASADLILMEDPDGHSGFARRAVRAALARRERRSRPWEVRPRSAGDHGVFATRRLEAGDTVLRFEERPHTLVSRSRVERTWDDRRLDWFRRYAYPLSDEIWVMWSEEPGEWRPLNHGCDPNAWLEGLDLVARRPIAPGEEVTMDYATFMVDGMPDFECACGAAECRKVIRGGDHMEDFVARYGEHVSDYVRRRRNGGR